ncbi:MAG: n-acetylglutamate synthase [Mucilaginibacter sp.]|nr:n-acetylglutamate synthase [Mucilaginibacter sp.]
MTKFRLENVSMNVIQTALNGVVNELTIFTFSQNGSFVSATYSGGPIFKGFLVGTIHHDKLLFSYCQIQTDGTIDNGQSECEITIAGNGKIRLVENFKWVSENDEGGVNIFQEL